MARPGRQTAWREGAAGGQRRAACSGMSDGEPWRLSARVTSVQFCVPLACARWHLQAPEQAGCTELQCSHKERVDEERLNRGGEEEKFPWSLGRRMGDERHDLLWVLGGGAPRRDRHRETSAGWEIAWASFSPILRRTFSPSLFPRAASLGAVSRDCLSHPFSFPP